MRKLTFSKNLGTSVHFPVLYEGFLSANEGFAGVDARLAHKILTKFEQFGEITEENGRLAIKMKEDDAIFPLEETEYALLKRVLDKVQWLPAALKRVVPALDWLDGLVEEKVG